MGFMMDDYKKLTDEQLIKVTVMIKDGIGDAITKARAEGIRVAGSGAGYDLYRDVERLIRGYAEK